jgi:subfamily B ATP-binding cassette protein MsbA
LQRGLAAAESVFALIDERPEPDEGSLRPARAQGRVTFSDVWFQYRTSIAAVLRGISLDVQPGETIALVGASGSGKTSLVNLLPRFYDRTAGQILLG